MQENSELMIIFKKEAQDLITKMRKDLSSLKEEIADASQKGVVESRQADNKMPHIKDLFRYAHTLKGSSQAVGFNQLANMSLTLMETFLAAKDGKIKIKPAAIPLLYNGVEACGKLLNKEQLMHYKELLKQIKAITCSG